MKDGVTGGVDGRVEGGAVGWIWKVWVAARKIGPVPGDWTDLLFLLLNKGAKVKRKFS